jgi:hypothetical protein
VLYFPFLFVSSVSFCRYECVSFIGSFNFLVVLCFVLIIGCYWLISCIRVVSYIAVGCKSIFSFALYIIGLKYVQCLKSETVNETWVWKRFRIGLAASVIRTGLLRLRGDCDKHVGYQALSPAVRSRLSYFKFPLCQGALSHGASETSLYLWK